jgi:hypothetical protein
MNKRTGIKNLFVVMACLCVVGGCQKKEPPAADQNGKRTAGPVQKAEAMLKVVGMDVAVKETDKRIIVSFPLSEDGSPMDAVVKSGLAAGAVAGNFTSDKPCVVIGLLEGKPASAMEVDLAKAQQFLKNAGEFSANTDFKVLDVESVSGML